MLSMLTKIFGLVLFFFALFSNISYAAIPAYQVTGKVVDSQTNAVINAQVSFVDESGKSILSGATGQDGSYLIIVSQGTYTVDVKAPSGINAPDIKQIGQIISGNTTLNFTLKTPIPTKVKSVPVKQGSIKLIIVVLLLIVIIGVAGVYLLKSKKRKDLPPSESTGI